MPEETVSRRGGSKPGWIRSSPTFPTRILGFDLECAQVQEPYVAHPQHPIDKQIAAIALIYDLTVVTRNTDDFVSSAYASSTLQIGADGP